ncbi:hypothetical protein KIW84_013803 [Lathyrus oleraceus]|uniref:Uncharacterized protein n=1 Tax=Pisum sativum TaxID=3888 RepID=A0A9D5GYP0_PEA|nr:hypothetical protein KIW84_013803 [Pisum sativum]
MCVRILDAKSNWNVPDQCLELFAKLMLYVTPVNGNMPTSYYDTKRMMSTLGLEVKKIDCCIGGCMLFYDSEIGTNDGGLEEFGVRMEKWDICIAWDTQKRLLWKWVGKVCGLTVTVGKTKDNEKATKDLEFLCNLKDLELKPQPNGKLLKPKKKMPSRSEEMGKGKARRTRFIVKEFPNSSMFIPMHFLSQVACPSMHPTPPPMHPTPPIFGSFTGLLSTPDFSSFPPISAITFISPPGY